MPKSASGAYRLIIVGRVAVDAEDDADEEDDYQQHGQGHIADRLALEAAALGALRLRGRRGLLGESGGGGEGGGGEKDWEPGQAHEDFPCKCGAYTVLAHVANIPRGRRFASAGAIR